MANKAARQKSPSKQPAGRQSAGTVTAASAASAADVAVVSGREPCPCGSGRRYKACHGRVAGQAAEQFVARPFEGLPGECDWVAMREIVPAATASLHLTGEFAGRAATLATVLPMAWPGLVRRDGSVLVGLQVAGGSGDASRDVADALEKAFDAEPGGPIMQPSLPVAGRRLQDLLDVKAALEVEVHRGFDFWLEGVEDQSPEVVASMERANEAVVPTSRLTSVEAAYRCEIRDRTHLRWVMPHDEDELLDGLAHGCTSREPTRSARTRATSEPSGQMAWSCRCGTWSRAPSPTRWRTRSLCSPAGWPRRWRTRARSTTRNGGPGPDWPAGS
jgi:hypothetical protein